MFVDYKMKGGRGGAGGGSRSRLQDKRWSAEGGVVIEVSR